MCPTFLIHYVFITEPHLATCIPSLMVREHSSLNVGFKTFIANQG